MMRLTKRRTGTNATSGERLWRTFVETLDPKSASSKLWRTIKTLDGKSTQTAESEAITFNGSQVSSPKQIANHFNEQFTTSKLGRHNSSRETRLVSRDVRGNPNETTVTITTDLVTRAIRSCSNTKAFGPDKLSIFHLKHLGPRATAYLTALFNDSVNSSRIPEIWNSSIVIPIRSLKRILHKAHHTGSSHSSAQRRRFWKHLYYPQSTLIYFPPTTNTDSDLDTLPPLPYYNLPQTLQLDSTKRSHSIGRSASL